MGVGKRSRGEAQATALAVDLAGAKEHAQWWPSDLKPQMAARNHQMVAGSDEAVSAWVADAYNRILGQELTVEEEMACQEMVHEGEIKKLEAWKKFKVFSPVKEGAISKKVIDSRWALTW